MTLSVDPVFTKQTTPTITVEDMRAAAFRLGQRFPYFSSSLALITYVPSPTCPLSACDARWKVYFNPNPETVVGFRMSPDDIEAMVFHEYWHLASRHFPRAAQFQDYLAHYHHTNKDGSEHKVAPVPWNVCGDFEMFQALSTLFPHSRLVNEFSANPDVMAWDQARTTEHYYMRAMDEIQEGGSGGQGKEQAIDAISKNPRHQCGSGSGGETQPFETSGGGVGESQIEKGMERTKEAMEREFGKEKMEESRMGVGNGRGGRGKSGGGGIGDEPAPYVDFGPVVQRAAAIAWIARIKAEVTKHMRMKGSGYARPSRRQSPNPKIQLPGRTYSYPLVCFVVDVSGSIDERAAREAFRVAETMRGWNIKFHVIACDTRAFEVTPGTEGYSGGGTHMPAGIDFVKTKYPNTDICIIISDGETDWGEYDHQRPPFPTFLFSWQDEGPSTFPTVMMPPLS